MKILSAIIFFLIIGLKGYSVSDSIGIKWLNGVKCIMYEVEKGQGVFTISKIYRIPVSEIRKINDADLDALKPGQVIYIPIKSVTSPYATVVKPDTVKIQPVQVVKPSLETVTINEPPGIHIVKKGETLYKIALLYNVSVADLQQWNNLPDNSIKAGDRLIIKKPSGSTDQQEVNTVEDTALKKTTGVFKTISVVENGMALVATEIPGNNTKKLALHKDAPIGTTIHLTNIMNGRSVDVKIVGNFIPDQNSPELIRISPFIAKELGIRDNRTRVKLAYTKEVISE